MHAFSLGYFISTVDGKIPSFRRAHLLSHRDITDVIRHGDFNLVTLNDLNMYFVSCFPDASDGELLWLIGRAMDSLLIKIFLRFELILFSL